MLKQGKGTADHLLPLGDWFFSFFFFCKTKPRFSVTRIELFWFKFLEFLRLYSMYGVAAVGFEQKQRFYLIFHHVYLWHQRREWQRQERLSKGKRWGRAKKRGQMDRDETWGWSVKYMCEICFQAKTIRNSDWKFGEKIIWIIFFHAHCTM